MDSTIPQYLTASQTQNLLQVAQKNGIDPAMALKSLADNGHIIQGFNDQDYQKQIQQQTQPPQPQKGFLETVGQGIKNLIWGVGKGVGSVAEGSNQFLGKITGLGSQPIFNPQALQANTPMQNVGKVIGESLPYVGAGIATGGLADLPLATAMGGEAAVQGATGLVTSGGNINTALGAAAGGAAGVPVARYVVGPLVQKFLGKTVDAAEEAVNSSKSAIGRVTAFNQKIGQTFADSAVELTEQNPDAVFTPTMEQLTKLDELGNKYRLNLPDIVKQSIPTYGGTAEQVNLGNLAPDVAFTPKQTQELLTELNTKSNVRAVAGMASEIKQSAIDQFNAGGKGIGDVFNSIYDTYRANKVAIDSMNFLFRPSKNITPEQINDAIQAVKGYSSTPEGNVIIRQALQNSAKVTGIDLSNHVSTIQKLTAVKSPKLMPLANNILKLLGFYEAANVMGHIGNMFGQ